MPQPQTPAGAAGGAALPGPGSLPAESRLPDFTNEKGEVDLETAKEMVAKGETSARSPSAVDAMLSDANKAFAGAAESVTSMFK